MKISNDKPNKYIWKQTRIERTIFTTNEPDEDKVVKEDESQAFSDDDVPLYYKGRFHKQRFNMHVQYSNIPPSPKLDSDRQYMLKCIFELIMEWDLVLRRDCDLESSPIGINFESDIFLDANAVGAIKYVHLLLTGQTGEIVTITSLRMNHSSNVNQFKTHEDSEPLTEQQLREQSVGEMSREVFVREGGIGHAVYLTGEIFKREVRMADRACILYAAIVKGTCQHYGTAITAFERLAKTMDQRLDYLENLISRFYLPEWCDSFDSDD
ncbi:MAG: hypothetical protein KAH18_07870 [Psychromonas sp.]|nr:hypothetical protein [Psychromonas sp.]